MSSIIRRLFSFGWLGEKTAPNFPEVHPTPEKNWIIEINTEPISIRPYEEMVNKHGVAASWIPHIKINTETALEHLCSKTSHKNETVRDDVRTDVIGQNQDQSSESEQENECQVNEETNGNPESGQSRERISTGFIDVNSSDESGSASLVAPTTSSNSDPFRDDELLPTIDEIKNLRSVCKRRTFSQERSASYKHDRIYAVSETPSHFIQLSEHPTRNVVQRFHETKTAPEIHEDEN